MVGLGLVAHREDDGHFRVETGHFPCTDIARYVEGQAIPAYLMEVWRIQVASPPRPSAFVRLQATSFHMPANP